MAINIHSLFYFHPIIFTQMGARNCCKTTNNIQNFQQIFNQIDKDFYFNELMVNNQTPTEVDLDKSLPFHQRIGLIIGQQKTGFKVQKIIYGTGTLISQNIVLTVAHNVYHNDSAKQYHNLTFFPKGEMKPFLVENIYVPEQFKKSSSTNNDYALLKLGEKYPVFDVIQVNYDPNNVDKSSNLQIYGYPLSKIQRNGNNERTGNAIQCGIKKPGKILDIRQESSEIVYQISTEQGQAGSPLIIIDRYNIPRIVGLHTGGIVTTINGHRCVANVGLLFNKHMTQNMEKYITSTAEAVEFKFAYSPFQGRASQVQSTEGIKNSPLDGDYMYGFNSESIPPKDQSEGEMIKLGKLLVSRKIKKEHEKIISSKVDQIPEELFQSSSFHPKQSYLVAQSSMKKDIHKHIGVLTFKNKESSQDGRGTGILISQNLVLTVASNIYDRKNKKTFDEITFYPQVCGQLKNGINVQDIFFPEEFKAKDSTCHDYALLRLSKKVLSISFLPFSEIGDLEKDQYGVALFGYPAKKAEIKLKDSVRESICQLGQVGKDLILEINHDKKQIVHKIQTEDGQAGSPIIKGGLNNYSIIGMHKGSNFVVINGSKSVQNVGILFDSEILNRMKVEAQKMGAEMFKVTSSKLRSP